MRIERIEIENWLPFGGSFELDLPEGPIAVVATYAGNPRRSNWAGKTAFLEAIRWALFGAHRKRTDDEIVHRGTSKTRVRLVFSDGFTVTRTKSVGKAVRLTVEHDGEKTTKKVAQSKIEEVLGLTDDDLCNTLHFAQGDIEAIVEKQSSKRRAVVAAWLDLESWERVASRIRAQVKERREELNRARARLDSLDDAAFELSEIVVWSSDEAELDLVSKIGAAAGAIFANRERQNEIAEALELVAGEEIRRQNRDRYLRITEEVRELRGQIRTLGLGELKTKLEHAAADSDFAASGLITAAREVSAARELVGGNFDGQCPVTCEACPVADDIRANTAAAKAKLDRARAEHAKLKADADSKKRTARELEREVNAGTRIVQTYNAKRELLEKLVDDTPEDTGPRLTDEEVAALRREKSELISEALTLASTYAVARQSAARFSTTMRQIAEAKKAVEELERELKILTLSARCVGPAGIPARIAERELGALEERANLILSDVGLNFRFAWDRELRDLTPTCFECGYRYKGQADKSCPACSAERPLKRSDELGILVTDGGPEEDVKTKSGGAKVLVGSAIRLAAGAMLRELRDTRAAWATIDEPFGPLDAENRAALASSFAGMLGSVGLEQAFVVSHDAALLDALPGRIEITREGSRSTVALR